jgi:hypothetical protein
LKLKQLGLSNEGMGVTMRGLLAYDSLATMGVQITSEIEGKDSHPIGKNVYTKLKLYDRHLTEIDPSGI